MGRHIHKPCFPVLARALCLFASVACWYGSAAAQEPRPDRPLWMREARVSPDGQSIAFVYRGQIWVVASKGGDAVPLTERQFRSTAPVWSPDSKLIAFASDRYNAADVFVMPAGGGAIRRLTSHSQAEKPLAFTSDGKRVVFSAPRSADLKTDYLSPVLARSGMIYSVPVDGGRERLVMPHAARMAAISPDGKTLAYVRQISLELEWRKREISGGTPDIWLYDLDKKAHRRLTTYRGMERCPRFSPDGKSLIFAAEMPAGWKGEPDAKPETFNLWRMALNGEGVPERLTSHDTLPVRFPSVAQDGTIVYTWDTESYRLDPGAASAVKVPVRIRQGTFYTGQVFSKLNDQITELAISPNDKEVAVVARGDVFVIASDSGQVRRITNTPQAERSVSFSPDGKTLLYAAERTGDWDLYATEIAGDDVATFSQALELKERVVLDTKTDALQPAFDPQGTRVAFRDDRNALKVLDLKSGNNVEVLPDSATYFYTENEFSFTWSPDGRFIAASIGFQLGDTNVVLIDPRGARSPQKISDDGFGDRHAVFSPDGSVLAWRTTRFSDRNLREIQSDSDVMAAYLTDAAYQARSAGQSSQTVAAGAEADKPDLNLERLTHRKIRVTPFPSPIVSAGILADNRRIAVVTLQHGQSLVGQVFDLNTRAGTQLFSRPLAGVKSIEIDRKGTALYTITSSALERIDLSDGSTKMIPFSVEAPFDFSEELKYLFNSQWRIVQSKFYDAKMHGVDWPKVRELYAKYVPHISHWESFAEFIAEMQGELNASHMYTKFENAPASWDKTADLGLIYDLDYSGSGMRVMNVLPGGPADMAGSAISPGAVILAVDGKTIEATQTIYPHLNHKTGRAVRLSVRLADGGKTKDVTVRPGPAGLDYELLYQAWVERRRALVTKLSGGRLAYVHGRKMDDGPLRTVFGRLRGADKDKDAAIVDTRFNPGGLVHDQLGAFLTGKRHAGLVTRNGVDLGTAPFNRWAKPSALIVNSWNYSDASVFAAFYQREKIGPMIGDRVPGTGTAVLQYQPQEQRLTLAFAQLGFRTVEGKFFENTEIIPGTVVHNGPAAIQSGRDPQLEKAVEVLLQGLE